MSYVFNSAGNYSHTVIKCVKCFAFVKEQVCDCHFRGERVCVCPIIRQCRNCDPSSPKSRFLHDGKVWKPAITTKCDCGKSFTHTISSPAYVFRCPSCPIDFTHNSVQKVKVTVDYIIYRVIKNMYYDPVVRKHFPKDGAPRGLMKKSDCLCSK